MKTLSDPLLKVIRQTENIVLATHINPDGDALGSLIGLAATLEGMGKRVFRYLEEPVSHLYSFLPDSRKMETDLLQLQEFTRQSGSDILCISLDCGDRKRLGKNADELLKIRPFAVIDHHKNNDGFGDYAWIDSERSSTGEMIYDLAQALGQGVSKDAGVALFAAIVSDTGSFRYESTSAHTFDVARKLVEIGVEPDEVSKKLYDNYTAGRLQLLQKVLATLEIHGKGKIAIIRVTAEMLEKTGCSLEDTENFINLPRSIIEVEAAVFIKETGAGRISVSMRAKGMCDVAEVAARFGGGGHRNAAGFRASETTIEEVRGKVLTVLLEELGN